MEVLGEKVEGVKLKGAEEESEREREAVREGVRERGGRWWRTS